jgi:hypothetical protein
LNGITEYCYETDNNLTYYMGIDDSDIETGNPSESKYYPLFPSCSI